MSAAESIRVLIAEDVATDAELSVRELKRAGLRVASRIADDEPAFRRALAEFAPHVILSDFSMPQFDGMAALAVARELVPDTPFIFVSGTLGEEYAIRALKNGATDYVVKTNLMRLPAAVERALSDARAHAARKEIQAHLDDMRERVRAIFDTLPDAVWSISLPEERLIYISGAAASVFGHAPEEFAADLNLGLRIAHPEDRAGLEAAWAGLREGKPYDIEYRVASPDGAVRWIHERARRVCSADGAPLRLDGIARDVTEQVAQRERINYLAYYDALTGLPNRKLFYERLSQALVSARDTGRKVALVVFDIKRFKAINESLGMAAGDRVLQDFARRLRALAGEHYHCARLGANEFGLLLPLVGDSREVGRLLTNDAASLLDTMIAFEGRELRLAAWAGVALYPEDGADAEALLRNAEAALKKATAGSERYVFYAPSLNARVAERLYLESRLRQAVDRREFVLHFQPKVDLGDRRMHAVEALLRWPGAAPEMASPARFIPVLEESGLIEELGTWLMREAVATHESWRARGLPAPRIAINVSAAQLRSLDFVNAVRKALGDGAGEDCGLDLEITESLLMSNIEESLATLRQVRRLGVHIALDDFGTGYSSLAYLSKLPIDTLKIDRSFIHGMTENADDTSIVAAMISLAKSLRLRTVAEGVETEEQARLLKLLRCDEMQGYLVSRPVPKGDLEALLAPETA